MLAAQTTRVACARIHLRFGAVRAIVSGLLNLSPHSEMPGGRLLENSGAFLSSQAGQEGQ